jgi:predicted RNA-binding protein with PIN domain
VRFRRIEAVPILIDGHNLIGRLPMLSLQDPGDEEELVRLLKSYRARTGKAITVVFDPGGAFALPQSRSHSGIQVVFAPHGSSADAVIIHRIQTCRDPHRWSVVTSDQELAETVARQGARVRSAEEFAAQLCTPQDGSPEWKDRSPSPAEVKDWLDLFEGRD